VLQRLEDRGLICQLPGQPARYTTLPPESAIEVLLLAREQDTVRGIDAPPYSRPIDGMEVSSSANVMASGVWRRFIHEHATLQVAGQVQKIERGVAEGEEVRILAQVPMKMILADDDLGLVPLRATPRALDSCILVPST
jgi:hypothetical protein